MDDADRSEPRLAAMAGAAERAAIRRATLRAQRAVEDLDAETAQALIDLYTQAADDIAARLAVHAGGDDTLTLAELRSALTQIEARLAELARTRDGLLMDSIERAAALGAEAVAGGVATAATMRISHEALAFIQTFIAEDGLQLSDRIWRLDRQARDRVVNAIEQAVIQGWGAEQAARELLGQGKPVPGELREKARAADVAALGRQVDELMTGPGSPMDNAMRVMRTEINRAHGEAYMMDGEGHPDFAGWRFLLSPAHPKPDICDLLSEQNLYGLGKGVYPDRERLPWPAHPNTLSFVVKVFMDEITAADRAGRETPMAALARLSPERREGVLGKGKAEVYEAGKLTQGMIRAPLKEVRERIGPVDIRDALTRQYFNGADISISGSFQPVQLPGGVLDRSLAPALLGVPDGAKVFVKQLRRGIEFEATHPLFAGQRAMFLGRDGVLHWEGFFLRDDAPAGLGTRMAATTILTAQALGIPEMQMTAWGRPEYNGSYTWARLGFDAAFDARDRARLERAGFHSVHTVLDLLAVPAGRAWWKERGWTKEMRFSLDSGGRSMKTFFSYLSQKGVKP